MSDESGNDGTRNDPERVGFCQDCGRALTRETVRTVGSGVFCEPCLEARIGGAPPPYGSAPPPPYGNVPPSPNAAGPTPGGAPYQEPFPPVGGGTPSPVLAGFLGLIPGVGAMYNGQFAKGIAHIVIFALLQSMARMNDFFGLLVAGWVFYQVFDAYHTAKARREGLPAPDPFGLNNIGGHVWGHFRGNGPGVPPNPGQPFNPAQPPAWTGYTPPQTVVPPAAEAPFQPVSAQASWGSATVPPSVTPYTQTAWDVPPTAQPPVQDWANTAVPAMPVASSRFPGAAVWLIGFGIVFLVINVVPEWRFSIHKILPFVLMAMGVGMFLRRMEFTGGVSPAADEGESYAARVVGVLRGPAILFTIGVLWFLQEFDLVPFHTWPVLVIVIGVVLMLERSLGNKAVVPLATGVTDANATRGDGKGL